MWISFFIKASLGETSHQTSVSWMSSTQIYFELKYSHWKYTCLHEILYEPHGKIKLYNSYNGTTCKDERDGEMGLI